VSTRGYLRLKEAGQIIDVVVPHNFIQVVHEIRDNAVVIRETANLTGRVLTILSSKELISTINRVSAKYGLMSSFETGTRFINKITLEGANQSA